MLLRDHPLMSYQGIRNWPPTWIRLKGRGDKHLTGEIGMLKGVLLAGTSPNRCLLLIFHEGSFYKGSLLFDDDAFFKHIVELLQSCSNRSIAEIGSIDLSHTS
jgi:hypothetical protein